MQERATFRSDSVAQTQQLAAQLASVAVPGTVVALEGDLGAGKTHFVQGFARALGITSPVTSPTFNVMSAYPEGRIPLYHFDLYRLDDPLELEDIAFYDLVEADGVSCIEWACKFVGEIPASALWISITTMPEGARSIDVSAHDAQSKELLEAWVACAQGRS